MPITPEQRDTHHQWLLELTQIPTAAGREHRVVAWIRKWISQRPGVDLTVDPAGNLRGRIRRAGSGPPVYFTAHMDHPAFTVVDAKGAESVVLGFRGGVMEDYFKDARVTIHAADGARIGATLRGRIDGPGPDGFPTYTAALDQPHSKIKAGDVATWELPPARIENGLLHTHVCDDLAALAAALAAYDILLQSESSQDVRLLFTRAEEIGFIGAIAACRDRTIEPGSRVLALENSRSFEDSPIGGGPIVRVGDRLSVFSPNLTAAVARRAEEIAGAPPPTASQNLKELPPWKWQRKLMAGGACEATVFCTHGYEATCLCLPLGNYHNMADLSAVQAGKNTTPARIDSEFISVADFDGLVDLLIACGQKLEAAPSFRERIDKLWADKRFVLGE
jgi:endoglucanase